MRNIFFLILLFIANNYTAQLYDYQVKYGLQSNLLFPNTEFETDSYNLSLWGRGFIKHEINSVWEGEIGFGIGNLAGIDFEKQKWETNFISSDLKINLSPFNSQIYSPYFFTGLGLLRWNVINLPAGQFNKKYGWDLYFPFGGGVEFAINSKLIVDLTVSYNFTTTDQLNNFSNKKYNDGFYALSIGFTFVEGGDLTDPDKDGIITKIEEEIGTDPNNKDTDSDGLNDNEEINTFSTNPFKVDSDNDKLTDYEESKVYLTDPNSNDTDGDDILDNEEIYLYSTNPNLKDTDQDEISDGYEVYKYNTNPTLIDTDQDGLSDKDEIFKTKTNPNKNDTDEDGIPDGVEVNNLKTNPLIKDLNLNYNKSNSNYKSVNLTSNQPVVLQGIKFQLSSAELNSESENALQNIFNSLNENSNLKIEIRGYTDSIGDSNFNLTLSEKRAESVKNWLIEKGISPNRIFTKGFGESNPIGENDTAQGQEQNRRIEIIQLN